MIKSISFKNFRRFAEFPEFKFGRITFLVGGNNSGKSTFLKALVLLVDNLRELSYDSIDYKQAFSFDMSHIHQLNIGTYERAHTLGGTEGMTFDVEISHFKIHLRIENLNKDNSSTAVAPLTEISIHDLSRNIEFSFGREIMTIDFKNISKEVSDLIGTNVSPNDYYNDLLHQLDKARLCEDKARIDEINGELEKISSYCTTMSLPQQFGGAYYGKIIAPNANYLRALSQNDSSTPSNPIALLLYNWVAYQNLNDAEPHIIPVDDPAEERAFLNTPALEGLFPSHQEDANDPIDALRETLLTGEFTQSDHQINHAFLEDNISTIRKIAQELNHVLSDVCNSDGIAYIQAYQAGQQSLYSINDRNSHIAYVIHQFARLNIKHFAAPSRFIKKWLTIFNIGSDYRWKDIAGEGHTFEIKTTSGCWQHLAELGIGSNHIVTLLLQLATLLQTKKHQQPPLIIIEEPEQNLHPKMQSKLAELFIELNKDYGFRFLIETHSEYLIRHSQVLVAQMDLNEKNIELKNPFKTYYFPESGQPYDMKYLPSGRFENKFGDGFFDESSKFALMISKIERDKYNGKH